MGRNVGRRRAAVCVKSLVIGQMIAIRDCLRRRSSSPRLRHNVGVHAEPRRRRGHARNNRKRYRYNGERDTLQVYNAGYACLVRV